LNEIRVNDKIMIRQLEPYVWEVVRTGAMRVPGRIFTDRRGITELAQEIKDGKEWNALQQVVNVACLPGIQKASLAMADVHPGYGFPIGGVGAFDLKDGVVSVAGVGYDINCGVRTLRTTLHRDEVEPKKERLADALFRTVPAGLGSKGNIHLTVKEMDKVLEEGAAWVVRRGYGPAEDLEYVEEQGCIAGADPATVSHKAKERELDQVGSLGSGNHYLEVQWVDEIYDARVADVYHLFPGQILVSIHSGSRALGHQIGTDYLKVLEAASRKYGIPILERELVCAPYDSPEGRRYMAAVYCGINIAFANRQALAQLTRQAFQDALGTHPSEVATLYEIAHNTARVEEHQVGSVRKPVVVHRKGATRAFGPGRAEVPTAYRAVGQPVLVGGTMGTYSFILHGTEKAMDETFGSALHGAGRTLSRNQAIKQFWGDTVIQSLAAQGIVLRGHSKRGLAEEAPGAYKDVLDIVDIMHEAGIIRKVARVRPLICIKG
jgi:tRNA-splicing ligase RtcB (3'-phosphate/5'-hydroxy nucleic acid ligase)